MATLITDFLYPEIMPQLWVNYSLYSSSLLYWAVFIFTGTKHAMHLLPLPPYAISRAPFPAKKYKTHTYTQKSLFFLSLKCFRTIKTFGRFGMTEWYVWGWIGSIFPMGYNKGFILNPDTVQHSFWSEVGRGLALLITRIAEFTLLEKQPHWASFRATCLRVERR